MNEKKILREKAKGLEPLIRVGKDGLKDSLIEEIKKVIRKRKLIKIKLLNSSLGICDKNELIKDLVERTNTSLIESVGNVVVIYYKANIK